MIYQDTYFSQFLQQANQLTCLDTGSARRKLEVNSKMKVVKDIIFGLVVFICYLLEVGRILESGGSIILFVS